MTIDLDALEKLADEATPGPWKIDRSYPHRLPGGISQDGTEGRAAITRFNAFAKPTQPFAERNAAFIAAANPATIKALIAELKEARAIIAETVEEFGCTIDQYNKIGPHWTSADGEMFDVGVVLERERVIERGRAFLARNGKGGG